MRPSAAVQRRNRTSSRWCPYRHTQGCQWPPTAPRGRGASPTRPIHRPALPRQERGRTRKRPCPSPGGSHRRRSARQHFTVAKPPTEDRKTVVSGKFVSVRLVLGGRRIFKKQIYSTFFFLSFSFF